MLQIRQFSSLGLVTFLTVACVGNLGGGRPEPPPAPDWGNDTDGMPPDFRVFTESGVDDFLEKDEKVPDEASVASWVQIVSPSNGALVENPVTFTIAASEVASVRLFADGYPIGAEWDPLTKQSLTHTFNGTGYEREIQLLGYDAALQPVASDKIKITLKTAGNLDKGTLVGQMWITYYYLVLESDYSGTANTTLYNSSCSPIATVPASFSDAVCIEGSGQLKDGRVINYSSTCSCGRKCPIGNYTVCYSVLDKTKYPWGKGAANNALFPLRSVATDKNLIPTGTVLYAEQWDGVAIPTVGSLGGFVHDGCVRADDVGGMITGYHYDFFSGTNDMYKALEKTFSTKTNFTVYKNPGRCSHLE
ncbi:MAG: 3D domain-containing protein [Pseudomonadota bacterium]